MKKLNKQTKTKSVNFKDFEDYNTYQNYYFDKMDHGWVLPQPTEEENEIIHRMARSYIELLMEKYKTKEISKDLNINKLYSILFKLNMLIPMEDDELKEKGII